MSRKSVWIITIVAAAAVAAGVTTPIILRSVQHIKARNLTGVVLVNDVDTKKQRPIANAKVAVDIEGNEIATETDASGLFQLKFSASSLLNSVYKDTAVPVTVEHPEYAPLQKMLKLDGQLYVLRMKPLAEEVAPPGPEIPVSDVRLRYTESARTSSDTGSALKSFEVVNKGNVPCNRRQPCSPDGKWKATIGGASLDAGEGNEFREARVSCVAGPCPFTRIEHDGFSQGGRNISVSVRDWSDTVSFVMEAEVTRTSLSDQIRISYPLIFGRGMNFSLPPSGQGPSIEATVGGFEAVYPIEPALSISWANCTVQVAKDMSKNFRCDLKPGYTFR